MGSFDDMCIRVMGIIINLTEEEEQFCGHNVEFNFGQVHLRADDLFKWRWLYILVWSSKVRDEDKR